MDHLADLCITVRPGCPKYKSFIHRRFLQVVKGHTDLRFAVDGFEVCMRLEATQLTSEVFEVKFCLLASVLCDSQQRDVVTSRCCCRRRHGRRGHSIRVCCGRYAS